MTSNTGSFLPSHSFSRLAKGSLIYGLGAVVQRLMGFFLLPLYTRYLVPADYGVIALVGMATLAVSGFLNLGTGNSMGLLFHDEKRRGGAGAVIWTTVMTLLVNGLVLVGGLFLLSDPINRLVFQSTDHAGILRLGILALLMTTVCDPMYSSLRIEERARDYVGLTLLDSVLTIMVSVYGVVHLHLGASGVMLGNFVGKLCMFVVLWFVTMRRHPFQLRLPLIRPLLVIGFPSIFGIFAFMFIDFSHRQILQRLLGAQELGIFYVGNSIGMTMLMMVGAFGSAWPTFFLSCIQRKEEAIATFGRVLTYYVLLFSLFTLCFYAAAKPVVYAMMAVSYHRAYGVIGMVAAAYALKGCYLIFLPGLYYARKLYIQSALEWVAAILNVGLNVVLISRLGMKGAAVATLVSYFGLCALAALASHRYLKVQYEWNRVIAAVMLVVLGAGSMSLGAHLESISQQLLLNSAVLSVVGVLMFFGILHASERSYISERWRGLRRSAAL